MRAVSPVHAPSDMGNHCGLLLSSQEEDERRAQWGMLSRKRKGELRRQSDFLVRRFFTLHTPGHRRRRGGAGWGGELCPQPPQNLPTACTQPHRLCGLPTQPRPLPPPLPTIQPLFHTPNCQIPDFFFAARPNTSIPFTKRPSSHTTAGRTRAHQSVTKQEQGCAQRAAPAAASSLFFTGLGSRRSPRTRDRPRCPSDTTRRAPGPGSRTPRRCSHCTQPFRCPPRSAPRTDWRVPVGLWFRFGRPTFGRCASPERAPRSLTSDGASSSA